MVTLFKKIGGRPGISATVPPAKLFFVIINNMIYKKTVTSEPRGPFCRCFNFMNFIKPNFD